jgi:hypothetical protein
MAIRYYVLPISIVDVYLLTVTCAGPSSIDVLGISNLEFDTYTGFILGALGDRQGMQKCKKKKE